MLQSAMVFYSVVVLIQAWQTLNEQTTSETSDQSILYPNINSKSNKWNKMSRVRHSGQGSDTQNTADYIMISYEVYTIIILLRIDIHAQSDQFLDLFQITILGCLPNVCGWLWFFWFEKKTRHGNLVFKALFFVCFSRVVIVTLLATEFLVFCFNFNEHQKDNKPEMIASSKLMLLIYAYLLT